MSDPRQRTTRDDGLARRRPGQAPIRAAARPAMTARRVALDALDAALIQGRAADEALVRHVGWPALERRDRGFAQLLVLTVLRRLGEIDAVVRPLLRFEPKEPRTFLILRLGAAQLLVLGTPPHAAVNETVRLAGPALAHAVPMLNAVLRRIAAAGPAALARLDAERLATPDWLWASWVAAYGEPVTRAIARAHLAEPPLDLRARAEPARWAELLGAELLPGGALRLRGGGAIDELPGFAEGAWWVQDAAAALPAALLGPVDGRPVLDLGAAPGGKAMQLAAAGARVTAVEVAEPRAVTLRENLARTGLAAEIVVADARSWRPPAPYPHVLLDAPCTATGTIRRHPDVLHTKRQADVTRLATLQDALLDAAAEATAPGGRLVYAVCSLQPDEGTGRVAAALARRTDLVRDPIDPRELAGLPADLTAAGEVRTLPCHLAERGGMDGFFVARLKKCR
jgi:16S rRNA (cytosine967-C5)-methyltransferase